MKYLPVLVAVSLAVLVSGCTSQPAQPTPAETAGDPDPGHSAAFLALVDSEERSARLNGASDAQLADIATARAEGKVTFALHAAAMNRMEACLMEWGEFDFGRQIITQGGTQVISGYINYPPGMEDSQGAKIYEQCDAQEASFINNIHSMQPASVQAFSDLVAQHQDTIRECLRREGIAASEMETIPDLMDQSQQLTFAQSMLGMNTPVDCLGESGIAW